MAPAAGGLARTRLGTTHASRIRHASAIAPRAGPTSPGGAALSEVVAARLADLFDGHEP